MVTPIIVMGMVLAAMPIGDYDKRLVILTKERGKITVFAKGARKQNSTLLACSQPFTFGKFSIYESKTAYNMISAEISNYFTELRNNLEAVYYGFYFCEFAQYLTRENVDGGDILKLLYQSLKALNNPQIINSLVRVVFELKIMVYSGEAPQVFECVKCGKKESIKVFSCKRGGLLCESCLENYYDENSIKLNETTIYTMQYIISSTIEKLYTFILSDEILHELKKCVEKYLNTYIDKEFMTLEFLENL